MNTLVSVNCNDYLIVSNSTVLKLYVCTYTYVYTHAQVRSDIFYVSGHNITLSGSK